jgi:glutamate dehydrogenase (NAD(P)+)
MEYRGASKTQVFETIEEMVRQNIRLVLEESKTKNILPWDAALNLAGQRVMRAMATRRWSIF